MSNVKKSYSRIHFMTRYHGLMGLFVVNLIKIKLITYKIKICFSSKCHARSNNL